MKRNKKKQKIKTGLKTKIPWGQQGFGGINFSGPFLLRG
jgi:hypothetical protein